MSFNPVYALIQTLTGIATSKIRFKKEKIGKTIQMLNGYRFTVFRHAVRRSKIENGKEPAVFCVRFHVDGMSPEMNIKFSIIPMFFILGLPGFREKYWMINRRNGEFQGLYEWASEEDAKNYADSFAMKFMTKRSVKGSVSYEIIPGIGLDDHMRHLGFR